jgi:mannose-1-phosphate guanylyltransferase
LRKLPSIKEVLLIGFYEESVFRDFLRTASEQFPNWTIKYPPKTFKGNVGVNR